MKNYYQVLGLNTNTTQEEIKKSYRKYASKFHPDKHNGDTFFEEKFKEIQEAYEILYNPVKKTNYDIKFNQQQNKKTKSQYQNSNFKPYNFQNEYRKKREYEYESKTNTDKNEYVSKKTSVKNFGRLLFWSGLGIGLVFIILEAKILGATFVNIGFWIGGIIWFIGAKNEV